jgi:hypothetical protein
VAATTPEQAPAAAASDGAAPVTADPRPFTAYDPVQGRRSRETGGLGASVAAAFYAKHQMIILAVQHSLELYFAMHGEYPRSHDEFMKNVVAVALNGTELPALPEGQEYIYVPGEGELGLQIRLRPADSNEGASR